MLVKRAEEKRGLLENEDGEFHQIKKVFIRHWQQSVIKNNQSSSVHTTWICKTQLYLTVWFLGIAVERTSRPGEKFGWLDLRWFSYHPNIFYNYICCIPIFLFLLVIYIDGIIVNQNHRYLPLLLVLVAVQRTFLNN